MDVRSTAELITYKIKMSILDEIWLEKYERYIYNNPIQGQD